MKHLKLFFACLLMAVLSIGQVWADATFISSSEAATSAKNGISLSVTSGSLTSGDYYRIDKGATLTIASTSGNIESIVFTCTTSAYAQLASHNPAGTYSESGTTVSWSGSASEVTFTAKTGSSNKNFRFSQVVITTSSGGSSNPTVSADPTSWAFGNVAKSAEASKQFTITGSNLTSNLSFAVSGGYTLSANSATQSAGAVNTTLTVSKNTSTKGANNGTLTISGGGLASNVTVSLTMTVVDDPEPTGTFVKFTGATIPEGYYVICSGSTTTAMKNVATSAPRIDVGTVTISGDGKTITNPDESVIWKLENLTGDDDGYFTLYNEETEKYAAFTSGNGNATLIATVTNYAKFNHVDDSKYEFQNKGKTGKNLRYNNTYGFASYSTSTGAALTLYKKAVPFALTINSSIANGSVGASEGSTAISSGSNVLSGTEVTLSNSPASGYKLKAYDVYKTGESTTKVTVTNGKFTMPDYAVTVSATFEATKTLSSITLSGTQRTSFWVGETFSSEGLIVTAHYDDLSSATVTLNSIITGYNMSTDGNQTVTVSYTEGTEKTATYDITVKPLPTEANPATVAEIHDLYDRLGNTSNTYVRGTIYKLQTFYNYGNADDGKYTYWLTDEYDGEAEPNHSNEFEIYKGLDFDGAVFSSAEDIELGQEVVVKGNLTKYTSSPYPYEFEAGSRIISRPKVLVSIALSDDDNDPDATAYQTEFTQGDAFSHDHMVVTAHYNSTHFAAADVTELDDCTWSGYNMSATGNQTVTVSYTEGGVTKTATYGISVAAPDLCEHKATISKGAEENGTFELSVSGEQCLDELPGIVISTILTAEPAEHYHLASVTATVGTVGEIANNECTISNINASTTITAVFAEDDKVTVKFAMGTENATGDVPADFADKYAGQSVTLPANPFTYTGSPIKVFGGWKHSLTNEVKQPGSYTITAADAAEDNITFTAVWNDLSPWATVYTSNVELKGNSDTKAYAEKVKITVEEVLTEFDALRACTGSAAGSCTVKVPAGTQTLHFHAAAWNAKTSTITVTMGETELLVQALDADAGIKNSSPYTLAGIPYEYYYSIDLSSYSLTEETTITFSAGSDKRFVLFGVNAVFPAAITLDPTSKDFGEVKENANAQFEFTITPNAMSTGDLAASIIGTDAAKFSVGAISENKVTVTFTPGEVGGPYSASLKIESDNAEVTAALSGSGITSATPEIGIDKTEVAFGNVEQNSTPATQSVAVTLSNIDENGVDAEITGSAFTISPDNLTADGSIVITPVTTTPGVYSETLTLSATGATPKNVTVTMTVVDEWAYVYTSNVDIDSDTDAQVTIGETNYAAAKTSKGSSATITLPQGVTKIHMHLVAWKGEAQTVTVSGDCFDEDKEIVIIANDGVSGIGTTYPLGASGVDYYCSLTPDNAVAANTEITIATEGQKRFVLFGVNQEGGVVPVLDHIFITGTMTNTTGWKTGDEITPEGLTVNAYYTLNNVEQTPVEVDPNDVVWSHAALVENQTEVTLTATYTDGVAKSANVNVTIEAVETGNPTIITDPASYLNFGSSVEKDAVVAPKTITVTLKNIAGATATLGGTNFSAFSIDDTEIVDGDVITVSVNTGTPGIYAGTVTIKDNDSETEKVINLSMTVLEPEVPETAISTHTKWVAATSADLVDGAEVLITGVKNAVTFAMGVDRGNNRAAVAGTLDDDVFTPGENTMSFILVAQEESKFALRASNGKYLYAAHSSSNYLKTRAAIEDGNAKWTLTATSAIANGSNTNETIRFNSSNNPEIFSCYSDETKLSDIKLYVPKQEEIRGSLTEGKMGTICPKQEIKNPTGASFYTLTFKEVQNEKPYKVFFDEIAEGASLEAGKPYLFIAEGDAIMGVKAGDPVAAAQNYNGFIGVLTDEFKLHVEEADRFYIVYENQIRLCGLGYFSVPAERAYLDMSQMQEEPVAQAPGRRRVCLTNPAANAPTDIDAINASEKPMKLMIDGQLFIIRGEKMFDATGRLVK